MQSSLNQIYIIYPPFLNHQRMPVGNTGLPIEQSADNPMCGRCSCTSIIPPSPFPPSPPPPPPFPLTPPPPPVPPPFPSKDIGSLSQEAGSPDAFSLWSPLCTYTSWCFSTFVSARKLTTHPRPTRLGTTDAVGKTLVCYLSVEY